MAQTPRNQSTKVSTALLTAFGLWVLWKAFGWQTEDVVQEAYKPVLIILLAPIGFSFLFSAWWVWHKGGKPPTN